MPRPLRFPARSEWPFRAILDCLEAEHIREVSELQRENDELRSRLVPLEDACEDCTVRVIQNDDSILNPTAEEVGPSDSQVALSKCERCDYSQDHVHDVPWQAAETTNLAAAPMSTCSMLDKHETAAEAHPVACSSPIGEVAPDVDKESDLHRQEPRMSNGVAGRPSLLSMGLLSVDANASECLPDSADIPTSEKEEHLFGNFLRTKDFLTRSYEEENSDKGELNDGVLRDRMARMLRGPSVQLVLGVIILASVLLLVAEMEYWGRAMGHGLGFHLHSTAVLEKYPEAPKVFDLLDKIFNIFFLLELLSFTCILGWEYLRSPFAWIDAVVVFVSFLDWIGGYSSDINPMFVRILRLLKFMRGVKFVRLGNILDQLLLLMKCIQASVVTLFWALIVLGMVQCIFGMLLSQLVIPYIENKEHDFELRLKLFTYYGTFSRSMLTMFEITLANWAPACRILVNNVSEWYILYFLVYRCLVGFAVLNVINAVFIQQTMSVASKDHELMIMRKLRDQEDHIKKFSHLFATMDVSGDGQITLSELQKMMKEPMIRTWLGALEIPTCDAITLFKLLDDGQGFVSFQSFVDGAARLKGPAKNMDIAVVIANLQHLQTRLDMYGTLLRGMSQKSQGQ